MHKLLTAIPLWFVLDALGVATGTAQAQSAQASAPLIYPAKGQSAQQQDRDRYECYDWARSQSGFDPARAAPSAAASLPAAPTTTSSATGSMARAALTGAAVGEIARNDAGRGAAVGALGATALARIKEAQAAQARQQAAQQPAQQAAQQSAQQAATQQISVYQRGFSACMEARGYTVK